MLPEVVRPVQDKKSGRDSNAFKSRMGHQGPKPRLLRLKPEDQALVQVLLLTMQAMFAAGTPACVSDISMHTRCSSQPASSSHAQDGSCLQGAEQCTTQGCDAESTAGSHIMQTARSFPEVARSINLGVTGLCCTVGCTCMPPKHQHLKLTSSTAHSQLPGVEAALNPKPYTLNRCAQGAPFQKGRFTWVTEADRKEKWIVASIGKYSVLWNFR